VRRWGIRRILCGVSEAASRGLGLLRLAAGLGWPAASASALAAVSAPAAFAAALAAFNK
jgi:hypothetical protein